MPIKNLNQFSIWIAHILRYLWLTLLFYYYNAPSESVCELSSYRVSELSLFAARIFEMDGDIRGFARFMFYAPTSEGHSPSALRIPGYGSGCIFRRGKPAIVRFRVLALLSKRLPDAY